MKILYLMAIDWNWIKQRPQFLVYELSKNNQVDVLYLHEMFGKIQLQNNNTKVKNCKAIPAIPLRDRNIFFSGIQKVLFWLKMNYLPGFQWKNVFLVKHILDSLFRMCCQKK